MLDMAVFYNWDRDTAPTLVFSPVLCSTHRRSATNLFCLHFSVYTFASCCTKPRVTALNFLNCGKKVWKIQKIYIWKIEIIYDGEDLVVTPLHGPCLETTLSYLFQSLSLLDVASRRKLWHFGKPPSSGICASVAVSLSRWKQELSVQSLVRLRYRKSNNTKETQGILNWFHWNLKKGKIFFVTIFISSTLF